MAPARTTEISQRVGVTRDQPVAARSLRVTRAATMGGEVAGSSLSRDPTDSEHRSDGRSASGSRTNRARKSRRTLAAP
jgi:hypothetical protein